MDTLTGFTRTNYCGDLRIADAGKTVSVCGWVQRQRDLDGTGAALLRRQHRPGDF